MICHGFKGGIGTASRVTEAGHTVGVLVQANHGRRSRLAVNGVPVGRLLERVPLPQARADDPTGSIIVVIATDAPLLPHQCDRLAQRSALGIGRLGGAGENSSGDFALAFATGNRSPEDGPLQTVRNDALDPLFYATIDATEEAILNALLNAETMESARGTVHALPHDELVALIGQTER
jgi:D-aminopeptidase